ncbi:MAG: hypothetical protein DIZ80_15745 [endosymbiont of Galathealinum brachiosum]|uniref:Methyltransferase type 11 domain-containing protein n=1 Tax=endosymbiont of Galathealinum brachiosum TaxID=2200906 RepID=A0A370D9H3_9GAMM|nr:MAG: hypothetical protein DIZ80_15745 [endosymbiont of Galathealinum brachiosum]
MHSKKESLLKRWHSLKINPKACEKKWNHQYWNDNDGFRVVSCIKCPSFDSKQQLCGINYGTPLRKCVSSSIEAHFFNSQNKNILEVGFGRSNLAKNLINRSGGTWTGIDPKRPKNESATMGKSGYGHATHIPFADQTFDKIFGIQSVEHWRQNANSVLNPSSYQDCITEIHRALKPGGSIYLDAPIHFHGNEMFIMGDIDKIKSLFPDSHWKNIQIEKWREDYLPLERYTPSENEFEDWAVEITTYPENQITEARKNGVVWLIVITAEKI